MSDACGVVQCLECRMTLTILEAVLLALIIFVVGFKLGELAKEDEMKERRK